MNIEPKDVLLLVVQIVIGEFLAEFSPENRRAAVRFLTIVVVAFTILIIVKPFESIFPTTSSSPTATPEITQLPSTLTENMDIVYRDGVPLVAISATCFHTGLSESNITDLCNQFSCNGFNGTSSDSPYQQICLPAFMIDQYEVSNSLYSERIFNLDDIPVFNITWREAYDFCKSRGGELPSEQQWELAARGQDSDILIFSLTTSSNQQEVISIMNTAIDSSWANIYGLSMNVREWVQATNMPNTDFQVVKGAGFLISDPLDLRLSLRDMELFDTRSRDIGFRCVFVEE